MSMFDNYKNLNPDYIPDNRKETLPSCNVEFDDALPKVLNGYWGEPIGYTWHYGDTFTAHINLNTLITIDDGDIVYTEEGESPDENTRGEFLQNIYNTYDLKRWVCMSLGQSVYKWKEISPFSYPKHAERQVYLQDARAYEGKPIIFSILNFRGEPVYTKELLGAQIVDVEFSEETSKKLVPGLYRAYFVSDNDITVKTVKSLQLEVVGEDGVT